MASLPRLASALSSCVRHGLAARNGLRISSCTQRLASTDAEIQQLQTPTEFQKKMLVWTKTYPSLAEVPEKVPTSRIKRAKDSFRIRVNIIATAITALLGYAFLQWGRRDESRGRTVEQQWRDQHAGYIAGLKESAANKAANYSRSGTEE